MPFHTFYFFLSLQWRSSVKKGWMGNFASLLLIDWYWLRGSVCGGLFARYDATTMIVVLCAFIYFLLGGWWWWECDGREENVGVE
jgi:hypothetical protein